MTQEWRIDADKAENGWVIRVMARGGPPSAVVEVSTWVVKDDEDLAGTIAAALASAKLTPELKKELDEKQLQRLLNDKYRAKVYYPPKYGCAQISPTITTDVTNPPQNLWERLNNKVFCR